MPFIMAGSRARVASRPCDNCGGKIMEIWHVGNHGERDLLETHCVGVCKRAWDGETGAIRYPGRDIIHDQFQSNKERL